MVQQRKTKGTGSIIPGRREGTWRLRYEVPGVDGKRKQASLTITGSKSKAERLLRDKLGQMDRGEYVEKTTLTVGEYLQQWISGHECKPRTKWGYEGYIQRYSTPIAGIPLQKLTPKHIQDMSAGMIGKNGQKLSGTTRLQWFRILHKALNNAVTQEYIYKNPCQAIEDRPKKNRTKMKIWDRDAIGKFFNSESVQNSRFKDFYYLALRTCMRRSELCALQWEEVDFDRGTISIVGSLHRIKGECLIQTPKNGKFRDIEIPGEVGYVLQAIKEEHKSRRKEFGKEWNPENLVFCDLKGNSFIPDQVTQEFARIVKRAMLPTIRLHDLRHTGASMLLMAGVPIKTVSDILGHSSIAITLDTYGHLLPGQQREALEKLSGLVSLSVSLNGKYPLSPISTTSTR